MRDTSRPVLRTLGAVCLLVATLALRRQAPHFEITPDAVLLDEPFRVALAGVAPGQSVTIRVDGNRGVWHSSASFRSDAQGRVEIADPMRLIWSASGERPATPQPGATIQPWVFSAEVNGKAIATATLVRRAIAEQVRIVPVWRQNAVMVMAPPEYKASLVGFIETLDKPGRQVAGWA